MNIQATDYFDQPLAIGDRVAYPVQRGSSAASLNDGVLTGFVALVPHPRQFYDNYLVREDQLGKSEPTLFRKNLHAKRPYLAKVRIKHHYGDKYINRTIKNVELLIKGPA